MEKLYLSQFKDWYEKNCPIRFTFKTRKQRGCELVRQTISMHFNEIAISLSPNRLFFINPSGDMCINGVKYVQIAEQWPFGTTVRVVAGEINRSIHDECFIFSVEK